MENSILRPIEQGRQLKTRQPRDRSDELVKWMRTSRERADKTAHANNNCKEIE